MNKVATISQSAVKNSGVSDNAMKLIDRMFARLKSIFPAWKHAFDSVETYNETKHVWLEELLKAGLVTPQTLKRGLDLAAKSESPFFPSVGQFIAWCQFEDYHALGLPNEAELIARLKSFSGYAKYDEHKFKYRSKAEYWLLSTIYNKYWNKREEDLLNAAPKALKDAVEKVKSGYEFPEIPVAIEQKIVNLPQEKTLAHIANCKAALKG